LGAPIYAGFETGSVTYPATVVGTNPTLTLFNLKYGILDKIRAGIFVGAVKGSNPTTVSMAGMGVDYVLFTNQSALATELRVGVRYLFDVTEIAGTTAKPGLLSLGFTLGLGI
jgi:hypothetical protein